MAILFRNISDLTIGGMTVRLTVFSGASGRIRVEIAPYNSAVTTAYTGSLDVTVTYNGEAKALTASPFTGAVSAVFAEADGVKSVTLSSAAAIVCRGASSSSLTVSWKGDGTVAAPELAVSDYSGLLTGQSSRIEWTVNGVPEGYRAYTIGIWYHFAPATKSNPAYTRSCVMDGKTSQTAFEHTIAELTDQNVVFYRIAVGLYPEDTAETAGRDDYVLYLEMDSPAYVCSGSSVYTIAPVNLRYSGVRKNRTVTLTWDTLSVATATEGFQIECRYDNAAWELLYWGTLSSNSYYHTITGDPETVTFRIRSYSNRSKHELSAYLYGPQVEVGRSNVYVGHGGTVVPAAEVYIGSVRTDAVLNVG